LTVRAERRIIEAERRDLRHPAWIPQRQGEIVQGLAARIRLEVLRASLGKGRPT
jgi:hypothetical protein